MCILMYDTEKETPMSISSKLGYCCINDTLRESNVYTGRKMIRAKFNLDDASKLAVSNCVDLLKILQWNEQHDIRVFRIGSEILTRCSDTTNPYRLDDLKDSKTIRDLLAEAGKYASKYNHHLSFHPGQFVCLASPSESIVDASILALECENDIASAICRDVDLDIPINIHVGGGYEGTFEQTGLRFSTSFNRLSTSLQKRLVIENDDKKACWSPSLIYQFIFPHINVPITFDFHHYLILNDERFGLTTQTAFELCKSTWGSRNMQVHYSQSPTAEKLITSHSDYYRDSLPDWLNDYDNFHIHLECKAKELGLLKYRQDFCS